MSGDDNLIAELITPTGGFTGDRQERSVDYQILTTDGYVAMTGTVDAILPSIIIATNGVWIDCVSGITTIVADAAVQGPTTFTTGVKGYFIPLPITKTWRQM